MKRQRNNFIDLLSLEIYADLRRCLAQSVIKFRRLELWDDGLADAAAVIDEAIPNLM